MMNYVFDAVKMLNFFDIKAKSLNKTYSGMNNEFIYLQKDFML